MTSTNRTPQVAIVDYGMGNLYNVQRACTAVGIEATITDDAAMVSTADGIILPGVGAFGDAMASLDRLGLSSVLREFAAAGRPMLGVCLGVQLLMDESEEFGHHRGLGIIAGTVRRLPDRSAEDRIKVPHVGWNAIRASPGRSWAGTPLAAVTPGQHMYFVHSYRVVPADTAVCLSETTYGSTTFCSAIAHLRVFACQFHPERSGQVGLRIYQSWAFDNQLCSHALTHPVRINT